MNSDDFIYFLSVIVLQRKTSDSLFTACLKSNVLKEKEPFSIAVVLTVLSTLKNEQNVEDGIETDAVETLF